MIYKEFLDLLSSNNCKLTPQRKEILRVMVRAKVPLTAREIFERIRKKCPQMSFDTVYRNLTILFDLHIVNKLDFQDRRSRYELIRQNNHYHHLVCRKCGNTWKIPVCPLDQIKVEAVPENFKVTGHRFEIFGYCRECQDTRD